MQCHGQTISAVRRGHRKGVSTAFFWFGFVLFCFFNNRMNMNLFIAHTPHICARMKNEKQLTKKVWKLESGETRKKNDLI
jgi:hypothetical protein